MSESAFYSKVKKYLDLLRRSGVPIWHYKTHGGGRTKRGLPDVCVVLAGLAIYIELKATGGKPTAIQLHRINEIQAAGGVAFVADSLQLIEAVLLAAWPPLVDFISNK